MLSVMAPRGVPPAELGAPEAVGLVAIAVLIMLLHARETATILVDPDRTGARLATKPC